MHVSGNPSKSANSFLQLTPSAEGTKARAKPMPERTGPKPEAAEKPAHLSGFKADEKQALRKILDTPLPPESEVLGRCLTDDGEIKTYRQQTGMQRVDIKNRNAQGEESVRTFASLESAPETVAPRGRVASVETKTLGKPGPQGHAPAVHTVHYANGLSQTLAQSESGDLFWMGMRQKPVE
jgi:hypothetical protein